MKRRPRLGVAVLVYNEKGHLLLGRRGKEPNYGKWVIPGGGIKFGETLEATAKREIKEETGLDINLFASVPPHVEEIFGEDEHRVIFFVQGFAYHGGADVQHASDLLAARFFGLHELPHDELSPVILPVLTKFGWL